MVAVDKEAFREARQALILRRMTALAEAEEHHAAIMAAKRADAGRDQIEKASAWDRGRVVWLGTITEETVRLTMQRLRFLALQGPEPIKVHINSDGGDVIPGLMLFDYMRSLGETHRIVTYVAGIAASMASVIVQAGAHRVMAPDATLMMHEISTRDAGKIGDLEDHLLWTRATCDRFLDIYAERLKPPYDRQYVKDHWERKDWFVLADEALKLGLVDEVR